MGTGLGLALVAKLVAAHGGIVDFDSAPGRTDIPRPAPVAPHGRSKEPMNAKILIADDDASIRLVLSQAFSRLGYDVRATGNAATLLKWVSDGEGDLVVTDVVMPDENVFDVLPRIRKRRPKLPVIVMSAQNTLLTAVNAAELGVFEYMPKPFDLDDIVAARRAGVGQAGQRRSGQGPGPSPARRAPAVHRPHGPDAGGLSHAGAAGRDDLTVLLQGESGFGKSLAARALHDLGRRREGRFVAVNLGAAPRERIDAELFGAGDGAPGKLAEADGGTLLLDEISDLPLDSQTRLLRMFDGAEPAINPQTGRRSDVRVIAATNRDLRGLVAQGLFREDLFFRLNVAPSGCRRCATTSRTSPNWPELSCCAPRERACPPKSSTTTRWNGSTPRLAWQCARVGKPSRRFARSMPTRPSMPASSIVNFRPAQLSGRGGTGYLSTLVERYLASISPARRRSPASWPLRSRPRRG